ncbi:MAG: DUF5691 domain-containing protein [Chryseolinea sp.]
MKLWEDIVNKATLGSAKLPLKSVDVPENIAEEYELIDSKDPEDDFLRFASLIFQYRQAGSLPLNFQSVTQTQAKPEIKSYCSAKANGVLKTILEEELIPFLKMWLQLCSSRDACVAPELIPELFDVALRKRELETLILDVSGNRGAWLCHLNSEWNFNSPTVDSNELWETGDREDRRKLLRALRTTNPADALELLKTTWASEGANEKVTFLEMLRINLSSEDLAWLEDLKEKGQKVNATILELIKSIPQSTIVRAYADVLRKAINIRKGKALLGMINKTSLEVSDDLLIPESVFKSGIDKLSSDKNISDNQSILAQLIMAVPPTLWNDHLQLSTEDVIRLFQKEKQTAFYLPALAIASVKFGDKVWIKSMLDFADASVIRDSIVSLINGLSGNEKDINAQKFFKEMPKEITQIMLYQEEEWSFELAKLVVKYVSSDIYSYNRGFYRQAAPLIPVSILDAMDMFAQSDEQKAYWKNQSDELTRLLNIKQQILQSFNA